MITIDQWIYSSGARYQIIKANTIPAGWIVTSVMWIIMDDDQNVCITKNHRWWELPWWHVEEWETISRCAMRFLPDEMIYSILYW